MSGAFKMENSRRLKAKPGLSNLCQSLHAPMLKEKTWLRWGLHSHTPLSLMKAFLDYITHLHTRCHIKL